MKKPLDGIRVIEFATFVAAPSCGRLLSDMGAEVIKIEHPNGDGWRYTGVSYKPSVYNMKHNPVFDIYNSGKKYISLNLKSPEGMAALHRMLEKTDVFLTNTRPAALERLGLSYEQLKEKYPSLIYALILGFGEKGPDAALPAFDTTAFWSRGGFLRDMSDAENYMPVQGPSGIGDTFTGYLLLCQINAALFRRTKDGQGELVKAGLYHNAVFGMGTMNMIAQDPKPHLRPFYRKNGPACSGSFCCADGEWIYFVRGTTQDLEFKIARMVGLEELIDDPRFATAQARGANIKELYLMFRDAFMKQPSAYWLEKLRELDIPGVRMAHFRDICTDEQAWANDYLEHVTFPDGEPGVMPTTPIEMESVGKVPTQHAPAVGRDTLAVLREFGYTAEEIGKMDADGAVHCLK